MLPTEANNPNGPVTLQERFTIYVPSAGTFASRYGPDAIRINKKAVDQYCYLTLVEYVAGTNKIRFSLDTGNVVYRHGQNGNLHADHSGAAHPNEYFELIPRADGTFYMKANDGLYVSAYDASYTGGWILRSSKKQPDQFCILEFRNLPNPAFVDDIKKASKEIEAEVARAEVEA